MSSAASTSSESSASSAAGSLSGSPPESEARTIWQLLASAVGAILILGLGVFGLVFFGRKPEVPQDTSRADAANAVPLVETATVHTWDLPFFLEVDGEAATYRVLTVGSEVSGRVRRKPETTRSGTFVNKGDLLFEIDPVNYQLDLTRQEARVAQAQEELRAVEVDLRNAARMLQLVEEENLLQQNHLERARSLFERKATSESELDAAIRQELASRNALQAQQNQLNALEQQKKTRTASLRLAEAELERIRVDLQRCTVLAPITGRVVDDVIEEGDYVKPGDPLVHISDSSRMEVKCSLKGEELAWIWQHGHGLSHPAEQASGAPAAQLSASPAPAAAAPVVAASTTAPPDRVALSTASGGQAPLEQPGVDRRETDPFGMPQVACEVTFEFEGVETVWDGRLARYEGTGIDRATRMFPCRVVVEEPQKTRVNSSSGGQATVTPPTLLSGMYVTVRIPIDAPIPLLRVPVEAVRPGEQLWTVRDGQVRIISARLVRVDGDMALVRQEGTDLHAGDQVVVSPLAAVADGMTVTVQESGR